MAYRSAFFIHAHPGKVEETAQAFMERGVFSECAKHCPGLLTSELSICEDRPDTLMVIAEWDSRESLEGWLTNPAREVLTSDLAHLPAAPVQTLGYRVFASFDRNSK